MTKIVNLFGGPGISKSRSASRLFSDLKDLRVNCEQTREFAKELTWQNRDEELKCQFHVTGQQLWRTQSLIGKVDVVISDSPVFLGIVYTDKENVLLKEAIVEQFKRFENHNYILSRNVPFNPKGRNQTEEEAINIDMLIEDLLIRYKIPYTVVKDYDDLLTQVRIDLSIKTPDV